MLRKLMTLMILASLCLFGAKPDEEGYVTDWLMSGPYPSYEIEGKRQGLNSDLLANGEIKTRPYPGMKASVDFKADKAKLIAGIGSTNEWGFKETKTFNVDWKTVHFDNQKISLDEIAKPIDDYFVMYGAIWLESSRDCDAKFRMGSDDDHKVWLNGELVGKVESSQGVIKDNFIYPVKLQQGLNYVLIKIVDRTHGCGFCFAVSDMSDKPMSDLIVYTDNPARRHNADLFNNGYSGKITLDADPVYDGKHTGNAVIYNDTEAEFPVKIGQKTIMAKSGVAIPFELDMEAGKRFVSASILSKNSSASTVLQMPVMVYSRTAVAQENKELAEKIAKLKKNLPLLQKELSDAKTEYEETRTSWYAAYAEREKRYAAERAAAILDAPKSTDLPLPMSLGITRSLLCINGEWEMSADRKNWYEIVMPRSFKNDYFRTSLYPVELVNKKDIYGPVVSSKGWEDFKFNPIFTKSPLWFRKEVLLKSGQFINFVCEKIDGDATIYLNGKECGKYYGFIGTVRIPLTGIVDGKNTLEVKVAKLDPGQFTPHRSWGLEGASYIETLADVHVDDAWVKTSWRKGTVSVQTEITNVSAQDQTFEMKQYVAERERVRLTFPVQKGTVGAAKTVTVKASMKWADPKIWGIGGKYGNPDLYQIVTDIYVGGRLMDRHVQPFGFREFWVHATDFYLNGFRIVLQGDTGSCRCDITKLPEVMWPLYRADGINIVRVHDNSAWDEHTAEMADRMGMMYYAQMYPILHEGKADEKNFIPYEAWFKTETHQFNLKQYAAWHRMLRNHPSVVIWSTDNEILTQAWDTEAKADFNVRNDRIGAFYEQYTKSLDPDIIMTRDGDVGTWNHKARWCEEPMCDTANYHYPDFNVEKWVVNWQKTYEYRPALFGETLYYSYGAWDNWIGPIPSQVAKKAKKVAEIAAIYRELEVPGIIFMGLGHDAFCGYDNTGKGSPWGITEDMAKAYETSRTLPPGMKADQYPRYRLNWPAQSGRGSKPLYATVNPKGNGNNFNWFDPAHPSHIRNAVNDAYRNALLPQPSLVIGSNAECIIRTTPFAMVWSISQEGVHYGVMADKDGRAWFDLPHPGAYVFVIDGHSRVIELGDRSAYASRPGFESVRVIDWTK